MDSKDRQSELSPPRGLTARYALRLHGVPVTARLGRLLGVDWPELGERLGREVIPAQLREIEHGAVLDPADEPLDVVFATMMEGYTHFASFEIVLALALEARGHRVRFVLCDQQFPVCEIKKAANEEDWNRLCAKCYAFGRKALEASGFEILTVSDLADRPGESVEEWDEIVEASVLKHFRIGVVDEETPKVRERRALLRRSAGISERVGRALSEMEPDRVIMSHGIYTTWGPVREVLNEAGVPVITYDKAKKRGTWNINWTHESAWWDVEEEWERIRDVPLTPEQESEIDAYLDSRRDHSADVLRFNFGDEEAPARMRERLDLEPHQPTFVLFTNVLWDAASTDREVVFDSPVDWVLKTIEWFADHPGRQLVVKIHPAEVVIGTNQPFASIIRARFPELPPNVRLIEPEEEINSWSVIRVADLGLVHTSTVGLEMPLEGVPCAVVSRTHYRGRGFTIDVETEEEYFDLIESWDGSGVDRERLRRNAKRYAHLLFERYQIPFPYIHEIGYADVRALNVDDVQELLESDIMRGIVASIEDRTPFLLDAG